jgi:hypothetical protein
MVLMGLAHEHELHRKRFSRNVGVGLSLGALVILIVLLSIAKIKRGDDMGPYGATTGAAAPAAAGASN